MKILIFTTDLVPIPELPTSGVALRSFGIAQGLKYHGHEVVISVPRNALHASEKTLDKASLAEATRESLRELNAYAFDSHNQRSIINEVSPDAIICGHWPAFTMGSKPSQALIIDLAGPHMLERHYQNSPNQAAALMGKLANLSCADYFIVSGAKQRLYFLSYLLRAAVERPESRILEITMPLSPELPEPPNFTAESFPRFVFGGVFLPWQDPSFALEFVSDAISQQRAQGKKGSLTLIGGKHPHYDIKNGVYEKLFKKLSSQPHVQTRPMLPYGEFLQALSGNDIAVDLMKWNLERELAVTIRSTSYLWAGLPVIYNDYADLSTLIKKYDAGWCVAPGSESELHDVCHEIYDNPELVAQKSRNAQQLAREIFSWDTAVLPLTNSLEAPDATRLRETDIIVDFPDSADLPIYNERTVEQEFLCRVNGLTRVECRIATHNRALTKPISISLYELEESKQQKLVAQREITSDNLKNNEWCALDCSPLEDSAGKTYVFSLKADESQPGASPWSIKGSPYPLLGLRHGGKNISHSALCFKTTCSGSGGASDKLQVNG